MCEGIEICATGKMLKNFQRFCKYFALFERKTRMNIFISFALKMPTNGGHVPMERFRTHHPKGWTDIGFLRYLKHFFCPSHHVFWYCVFIV